MNQNYLTNDAATALLNWLMTSDQVLWQQEHFQMYGKNTVVPRQLAFFGDCGLNYRYTGIDHVADGWPRKLQALRCRIEESVGCKFNYLLLNRYNHGSHYMGWHRDNETAWSTKIASLSLGACRSFRVENQLRESKSARPDVEKLELRHGSLLVFDGGCRHTLAKTRKQVGVRINLTFRQALSC
ncbi:MAG: alpha-ketoglutarate-dependent dioxygenase AlkB [Gammaproteobacteria bacterium]|nr:alpha-ketoglutarate-dependent dioxygenase AlkB [Gammaproteobacteria bacterium]